MKRRLLAPLMVLSVGLSVALSTGKCRAADEEVFSGPQVGENLVSFKARGVMGDLAEKEIDLVQQADGKPLAIIFVHEVTRPSLGLTRLIMNYAAKRAKDGLTGGVVFLTDDATDTENWMKRAARALPLDVPLGISVDGGEGPGAYGLNRNVALTVLVGNEGKVTANFALVQPSVQADAPKIAKAIVDVLGGGEVPTLAELGAERYMPAERPRGGGGAELDPQLGSLVRALIQKTATPEQVEKTAREIDEFLAQHELEKPKLGAIASRIINAGKLADYGTPPAQEVLKRWMKDFTPQPEPPRE